MSNDRRCYCGRKVRRTEMTKRQLDYAIRWCKSEIKRLQKELEKRYSQEENKVNIK